MTIQPSFTIRQLLEAGVHYGHHVRRWNPKMAPYIFGTHNGIHILDLQQTAPMLHRALEAAKDVVSKGGRLLFVGTKRQASALVAEAALKCGQYYVNHRWLGGMLTNWRTVSLSIRRLKDLEKQIETSKDFLEKKEILELTREKEKLEKALGGIKEMGGLPDMLFVIDTHREKIAVREAQKLNIPVMGIVDSNADCKGITYPIPGNDDATRAIELYCQLMVQSILEGVQAQMMSAGVDLGAMADLPEDVKVKRRKARGTEEKPSAPSEPISQELSDPEPSAPSENSEEIAEHTSSLPQS